MQMCYETLPLTQPAAGMLADAWPSTTEAALVSYDNTAL